MAVAGNRDLVRRLRVPAYAFLGFTLLLQIADLVFSLAPFAPGLVIWRFQAIGSFSSFIGNVLLLLLLLYAVALLQGDSKVITVVAVVCAVLGPVLFLAAAGFALDALQLTSKLDPTQSTRFRIASLQAIVKMIVNGCLAWLFAASAIGSWRQRSRDSKYSERAGEDVLIRPRSSVETVSAQTPRSNPSVQ